MSAYIQLDKQDAFITPHTAYKKWAVWSGSFEGNYIEQYDVLSGSEDTTGFVDLRVKKDLYRSLEHLYYSGVTSTGVSSSYEAYLSTTLFESSSRTLPTSSRVIMIPQDQYGISIRPGSFTYGVDVPVFGYQRAGYVRVEDFVRRYSSTASDLSYNIYDDGEGNILEDRTNQKVGDIMYSHGFIVLTDSASISKLEDMAEIPNGYDIRAARAGDDAGTKGPVLAWQSTIPIFTHNYRCKIKSNQLTHTLNTSATTGSKVVAYDGVDSKEYENLTYLNNLTGSEFQPYVTTVGLYNSVNELVAVAKTSQPIPRLSHSDITFVVNLDI